MFNNFLRTALRQLWQHKLHTLIKLLSLGIGLTVFMCCFLYVKHEFSVNRSWPEAGRVHRLVLEQKGLPSSADGEYTSVNARAWPAVKEYFSTEVERLSRYATVSVKLTEAGEEVSPDFRILGFVDADFFDIFQLELRAGSLHQVREGSGYIAVSMDVVAQLGERVDIGRRVVFDSQFGTPVEYEVAAHYAFPGEVNFYLARQFSMLTLIDERSLALFRREDSPNRMSSWEDAVYLWARLREGVTTEAFNAMQSAFVDEKVTAFNIALGEGKRISEHLFYVWQPLTQMHFNPVGTERSAYAFGDYGRVASFVGVGLLILLIGCSNMVSMALAAAIERRREIGIRKSAGALPRDILWQFLGEALLLALLTLLPTALILELVLPVLRTLSPNSFIGVSFEMGLAEYAWLLGITLAAGAASGWYPALVLSRVGAQTVLRPGAAAGARSGQRLRAWLVGLQFCIASILLMTTAALYLQLQFTSKQPLGYDADNLAYVVPQQAMQQSSVSTETLINTLAGINGIKAVLPAISLPNANMPLMFNTRDVERRDDDTVQVKLYGGAVWPGHFEFLGIPVVAGRSFDEELDQMYAVPASAQSGTFTQAIRSVLNVSAVRALGYSQPQDAVGRQLVLRQFNSQTGEARELPLEVIGVVADSMYGSNSRLPLPEIYQHAGALRNSVLLARYDPGALAGLQDVIQAEMQRAVGSPVAIRFLDQELQMAFQRQRQESRLLLIGGALALLLACTGLFGLAAFSVERNVKEVGVRKVLGATVPGIVRLYLWRFAVPVLLAGLLAWPVATWLALRWIQQFPYQMQVAWLWPLGLGMIATILGIALLSVGYITLRAALRRPVYSLRTE